MICESSQGFFRINFPPIRALKFITGHVIYNLAYTYKFQLKTTLEFMKLIQLALLMEEPVTLAMMENMAFGMMAETGLSD